MNDSCSWDQLWDQQGTLNEYTGKGIDLLERIMAYSKERASIELEYSSKLKALSKKTAMKMKSESELWNSVSYVKGFHDVIAGIVPVATQHELIAENLKSAVIPFTTQKIAEYRVAKKQLESDNSNLGKQLRMVIDEMAKSHKEYVKCYKETEAAMLKYAKAEKNMDISRLELEKTKNNYQQKCGMLEESKQTYAVMTTKANEEQSAHYDRKLPQLLDNYKKLHTNRILDTVEILSKCVEAESCVNQIIASCHNDMRRDIGLIDPSRDANLVVENMKSGHPVPQPFVFEDLGHPQDRSSFMGGGASGPAGSMDGMDATMKKGGTLMSKNGKGVARKQSMHQKFFGGGTADKKTDSGDYGTLPPQQRARKIAGKISDLEKEKDRATQSREGVSKMQAAYRENPKLGNPSDCDAQLAQYGHEIDALSNQIQKFKILLDDVNAQLGAGGLSATSVGGSDTPPSIRSVSSASSGVTSRVNTINDAHRTNGGVGGGRRESFSGSNGGSDTDPTINGNGHGRDELYEECSNPNPVLGEAIAQFAFDGAQDGTIRMEANEKLWLIEKDEGDGWTRVRKENNSADGFVPSSYLKVTWFGKV
ncbi:Transducer of Cdc42-dependent actin assembly protein 1 homolog [Caenorhabditis elegans]|uniref:Transducer of Cdc42-dependent actin assembly protein 1 homolog n=1 Tax=Caenorhabditis elegans TaxID=6239 RepID=TOCA1_CAEEL|nr:Transducer of Cdc42-dependent actin assembly protein 1 homolog [Caenorhabditis elegans]Q19253.2 RecName: Full=Transducer of Cdc42-dependent actin assembly protein 1 homolog [Caenorhabditis elegans]CCD68288.1 Transducer of Cdc42-dependent actin assembly protein 1 homolog [Caenorhabditis elegans]|eukprot:NP_741723.1 Transducer of Cdc42-dependent actin assembly protein 1 homolog [Caenorhabditis elegans]